MNSVTAGALAATAAVAFLRGLPGSAWAGELFPAGSVQSGWTEFRAAGFTGPVCGVIYRLKDRVTNGMPLGAIDTGCIDLETRGTFGYWTIFNTHVPNRGGAAVRAPLLAMAVGGKTWALCGDGPAAEAALPHLAAWLPADLGPAQPAWGMNPSGVPGWAKSVGTSKHDLPRGRVFCHDPAVLRWTSPLAGRIEIRGGLWITRNLGRVQQWGLRKNGVELTGGQVAWGPTSAAPQPYASGSGGAAALKLAMQVGDRVELVLEKAAVCDDFVGVDLTIVAPTSGKTWDLAADWSDTENPNGPWAYDDTRRRVADLFRPGTFPHVARATEIYYWGHYPIADVEFETTAPVQVGLRAWTSFIPGALVDSMIPGAMFEVHLRNPSGRPQSGTIALSFPGPSPEEAGADRFERTRVEGDFAGVEVKAPRVSYALGVLGREGLRVGGELGYDEAAWTGIGKGLPEPAAAQGGSSAAVDFSLARDEEKIVRFVLAWHAPVWRGGGTPAAAQSNPFTHMYAKHYPSAVEAAQALATRHQSLRKRVLAWQQVVYAEKQLPPWLRDALINNLYMIAETGLWAQAKPPLGKWCRPEDGLFGMIECPRECPQIECIPCSLYGNIPLVYFFPELALSTLRGYKNYQWPEGMVVWVFGPLADFASPARPYQVTSSDVCLIEMIDKMWLRTGDDAILREFYDAAKRATIHAMNLRPAYGAKQVIAMPTGDKDNEWFEFVPLYGLVSHVGGLHLAQLRMMRRMAQRMQDAEFAKQCDRWFEAGAKAMEEDLWAGSHYRLYHEIASGRKSDVCLGFQLDGEWIARFHGLPGVFPPDRVKTTLATIARANADPMRFPYGVKVFANADGSPLKGDYSYWRDTGTHAPSCFMLGMTYLYHGQREFGEAVIRRVLDYVVIRQGNTWDFPLVWDVEKGTRYYGSDYYQNMMLWSVPAVLAGQDLSGPCKPGGLVHRILEAGRPEKGSRP